MTASTPAAPRPDAPAGQAEGERTPWTPGPWAATRTEVRAGAIQWWITACPASNMEKEICELFGDREAANARLIAAAPDLFAALQGLVAAFEGASHTAVDTAMATARAALARAEAR